jgi:Family of unknown function (DUF6151)
MPTDLPLQCACGNVHATVHGVSADRGNRVVCYCDDCQAFAHFLERAPDVLDADGGTDIFQTSPARLEITAGADRLACVRLAPTGLLRWYTGCCRTPIGNTLATRRVPFVGLILGRTDSDAERRSRDDALGAIRARLHTRFAKERPPGVETDRRVPVSVIGRVLRIALVARLRGEHRRSPFFASETGAPASPPRVLAPAELAAIRGGGAGLGFSFYAPEDPR